MWTVCLLPFIQLFSFICILLPTAVSELPSTFSFRVGFSRIPLLNGKTSGKGAFHCTLFEFQFINIVLISWRITTLYCCVVLSDNIQVTTKVLQTTIQLSWVVGIARVRIKLILRIIIYWDGRESLKISNWFPLDDRDRVNLEGAMARPVSLICVRRKFF